MHISVLDGGRIYDRRVDCSVNSQGSTNIESHILKTNFSPIKASLASGNEPWSGPNFCIEYGPPQIIGYPCLLRPGDFGLQPKQQQQQRQQ